MNSNKEERIQLTICDFRNNRFTSFCQSAAFHNVALSTLTARAHGRVSRHLSSQRAQYLSIDEELVLIQWIRDLQRQRMSPNSTQIRFFVTQLCKSKGLNIHIGKH